MQSSVRLAVLGLGLIGGSVARALRSVGAVTSISGYDPDPAQRELALERSIVDSAPTDPDEAVHRAQVVVLAVPVLHTMQALRSMRLGLSDEAVVTDVGSTKQSVLRDVAQVFGKVLPRFVAGHPIAGTEKSGVDSARADLFRGRRVVLTPHEAQDPEAFMTVRGLWESIGSRVVVMDAARHDAIFAATSHLPHLLAYSFVDMLARRDAADELFTNAGGGFRDFTRIASSSPRMWHDIIRANSAEVGAVLEHQIAELSEMLEMMRGGRWDELLALFERARDARERHLSQIE